MSSLADPDRPEETNAETIENISDKSASVNTVISIIVATGGRYEDRKERKERKERERDKEIQR